MTPILFIPGLACGEGQWRTQADHYASTRETEIFELPRRFGLSVEGHLQALEAKLELKHWEKVILVGHSLGGNLAAAFARLHPETVESVVLVDPTGDLQDAVLEDPDDFQSYVKGWFEELLGDASSQTRDRVLSDLAEIPRDIFLSTLESYRDYDFSKILAGRVESTLCVDGEGIKGAYAFQRLYPEMKRVTLPKTGHWLHLDSPEAFQKALKGFSSL